VGSVDVDQGEWLVAVEAQEVEGDEEDGEEGEAEDELRLVAVDERHASQHGLFLSASGSARGSRVGHSRSLN